MRTTWIWGSGGECVPLGRASASASRGGRNGALSLDCIERVQSVDCGGGFGVLSRRLCRLCGGLEKTDVPHVPMTVCVSVSLSLDVPLSRWPGRPETRLRQRERLVVAQPGRIRGTRDPFAPNPSRDGRSGIRCHSAKPRDRGGRREDGRSVGRKIKIPSVSESSPEERAAGSATRMHKRISGVSLRRDSVSAPRRRRRFAHNLR
jgi:hypothetical protein